jgi:hypothetical protein
MANCCFVDFEIEFTSKENKETFFKFTENKISECKRNDVGVYFGSESKYLFDVECSDVSDLVVDINCWVKWSITNEQMVDILNYIISIGTVKSFIVKYQELGNLVYGKYVFENNILKDYYLEDKDILQFNGEEDIQEHISELDAILDNRTPTIVKY